MLRVTEKRFQNNIRRFMRVFQSSLFSRQVKSKEKEEKSIRKLQSMNDKSVSATRTQITANQNAQNLKLKNIKTSTRRNHFQICFLFCLWPSNENMKFNNNISFSVLFSFADVVDFNINKKNRYFARDNRKQICRASNQAQLSFGISSESRTKNIVVKNGSRGEDIKDETME